MSSISSFIAQAISSLAGGGRSGAQMTLSCAGESVVFPILPASYEVENPYNVGTLNINSLGDIAMIGKRGLKSMSFNSILPAQDYSFNQASIDDPFSVCTKIESFATKGQPCRLSLSSSNVNLNCLITSFNYGEKDGTGDVYFTLSIKEYRYIAPTSEVANEITGLNSRIAETVKEKRITVYPGMHLMDVAAQSVGQFVSIDKQGIKRLQAFKSLVKNKNLNVGSVLHATKTSIKVGKDTVIDF